MSTISKEQRAALQSVRAKARKALAVSGADLPKSITDKLTAVVAYVDAQLKPAAKVAAIKAKTSKGKRAKSAKAEPVAVAA